MDRQRVQGQVAERARPPGPEILTVLEARIAENGGTAIERRPFADAEAAGLVERYDPYEGYERFVRRTVDVDALKARRRARPRRADVGRRGGLDLAAPRRRAGSGSPRSTRSATRTSAGVNPEPIRPNIDEALGMLAGGGYDLGLMLDGDADRAGAADEQGTFIHQLEVTGLLMYYLAEHRGLRQPVVIERQQHLDGRPARRALRDRRSTRPRSASSTSARR